MDFANYITGCILIIAGFLVYKFPCFIAGYNTLSKNEKEKIDIRRLSYMMCNSFVIMGAGIIASHCFLRLVGSPMIINFLIPVFVFPITIYIFFQIHKYSHGTYINMLYHRSKSVWVVIVVVLTLCGAVFYSFRSPSVSLSMKDVTISGSYGQSFPLKTIESVELIDSMPEIRMRTNGFSMMKIRKGHFLLGNDLPAMLYLEEEQGPYVLIMRRSLEPVYINFTDKEKTETLYKTLKQRIIRKENV
ncbi:DUF3784 domain-containing protein [Coprobacter secundus]|uniref:Bacterial Pleckstrin homology domain-containing protein n=1 Tax=Coprobacter secundus subsp. similis TaxID=2751153 RepID=A0A7G1HYB5_9BACT|nr:DUF3784 domain-containing protein [Coprobacter secundus]BCI64699.1 hypothetical protein Cop2CBH44_30520 [Coprobacter secundus subsp. similis]CCY37127.1 uncharacterized protein BN472_01750 [Tannerella sp. CAG:118]